MVDETGTAVSSQLRELTHRYAWALDDRDPVALCRLFHPDAVLRIFPPGAEEPPVESRGHDQLVLMVQVMRQRYERTMHIVSNDIFSVAGDRATGQVYCVAHHLIREDGRTRKVAAYLTYRDSFRLDPTEGWKFSQRDIHFLWIEEAPVPAWEEAVERARLN